MTGSAPRSSRLEFDPLSQAFFEDPSDVYRALRDEAPLYYDARLDMWVVSRYDDVAAALKDWETFSSAKGVTLHQVLDPDFDGTNVMMTMDPPQHTRLRALVSRAFTPRAIANLEPSIRAIVRNHLAPLEAVTDFDAVTDFSDVFPVNVICSLLGVPTEDGPQINEWISSILHREPSNPAMTPAGMQAAIDSGMYFYRLAEERRARPTDDMISLLCNATIEVEDGTTAELELREVAGFVLLMTGAGTETVTKLLGCAIVLLDRVREVREKVVQHRSLLPAFVDETMRWAPPAQYMCRTTTREATLSCGTIPAGSRVMLTIGSAMRDPRAFPDPDDFRLDREPKVPLGFGYGIHACLGTALARLEAKIALEEFLTRWPDYTVDTKGLKRVTQENTAGYAKVPVRVSQGAATIAP